MKNLRLIPEFRRRLATVNSVTLSTTRIIELETDIRYIQELLGHGSSKTTEIYTHVSKKSLANIKSPLDEIIESQSDVNQKIILNKNN